MLKQIAWNTFKNTGDINTFMELMEVDKAINSIENVKIGNENGNYKNKGNNNSKQQYER